MDYSLLGKYIHERRKELGLTLNKFAMLNDVEPAVLSRIENNHQGVKIKTLENIVKGFNQTIAEFLSDFEAQDNFQ
ncbi:helix-turn-helix transcriptional regulator [bacterium]|nr:helix-turn-helix transcriptional regulator [bacterium]